ncbi:MAG: hypothetical protein K2X94_04515 [Amoebophilaceae bacterium]|nr:hypothetical protein [Amoebophilaceae bacterium]
MKAFYTFWLTMAGFFCCYQPSQAAEGSFIPDTPAPTFNTNLPGASMPMTPAADALQKEQRLPTVMETNAMVQCTWLASMIVPGLGQIYNKAYWKVPCFYLGFIFLGVRIYKENKEMNHHERTSLIRVKATEKKEDLPTDLFTQKRIKECKRTRDLFTMIAAAWYLLNVFDAYAGAHGRTVNFKDDIHIATDLKTKK